MRRGEHTERRGSILDLFLIFLLLLCLLGILLRWQELHRGESGQNLQSYTLTAYSVSMDTRTADCLAVGDSLYTAAGDYFGYVTSLTRTPAKVTLSANGTYYNGAWDPEARCALIVEIEVDGVKSGAVLLHGGTVAMALGESLTLYSERMLFNAKLYNFTLTVP